MIAKTGQIWVGWNDSGRDSDLRVLSEEAPDLLLRSSFALITCLDSNRQLSVEMPSITKITQEGLTVDQFGDSLLIGVTTFIKLATGYNLFNGFDEAWFLHNRPASPPEGGPIDAHRWLSQQGPGIAAYARPIEGLDEWMQHNNAVLGISDGVGLSFITTQETLARALDSL